MAASLALLSPSRPPQEGLLETTKNPAVSLAVFPTTTETNVVTLAASAGFGRVSLAIEPLELGATDGKGLSVTDSIGQDFFFAIGDDNPIQIYSAGAVQDYVDTEIVAGEEYQFIVYVLPEGVEVYGVGERGVCSLLHYPIVMVPPLQYDLQVQRTGAVFRDVVLRENGQQP
jgi:hypothetical protein